MLRRVAATVGPGAVDYQLHVNLALRIAPQQNGKTTELGVLVIHMLDGANFLARSVYTWMDGSNAQRDVLLAELHRQVLCAHGIVGDRSIQELLVQVAAVPEHAYNGPSPPVEFLCPIGEESMNDPVTTDAGQTYEGQTLNDG